MGAAADGDLHVYAVNVGQGDTTVIVSPGGKLVIIDAVNPSKLLRLLDDLGNDGTVDHLVITHPHTDHFGGGNGLAAARTIAQATVAPFWHEFGMGPSTYRQLMGRLEEQGTRTSFLSGYNRWYPDGAVSVPDGGTTPEIDPDAPYLELLGPTNGLVRTLEQANIFNTNHLSIMSRLSWRRFRMVSCGDAQMENWSFFDHEHLLEEGCQVLRSAHHGSGNGTQWERLDRLDPSEVIVSSDPGGGHQLPDLTGTAVFVRIDSTDGRMAVITRDSGTIHLRVTASGRRHYRRFGDGKNEHVDLSAAVPLTPASNPTDWAALLQERVAGL